MGWVVTLANIYNAPHHVLTHAVQDAMHDTWRSMCISEGWLDSKGIPTPHDGGTWAQDNEMAFVQYVADEGTVQYHQSGPVLRQLANRFGYKKGANLKAAILESIDNDLLTCKITDGAQWLSMTEYGRETLARYEHQRALDIEIGEITDDTLPTQDEIEIAAILWECDHADAENRLISGDVEKSEGLLI